MANEGNMATLDERGPGCRGVIGRDTRCDGESNGKNAGSYTPELAQNPGSNHDIPLRVRGSSATNVRSPTPRTLSIQITHGSAAAASAASGGRVQPAARPPDNPRL